MPTPDTIETWRREQIARAARAVLDALPLPDGPLTAQAIDTLIARLREVCGDLDRQNPQLADGLVCGWDR